jgi:hypothetical protein
VINKDTRDALKRSDHLAPKYLLLIDTILTLPKTSLENENRRRIAAVNAIIAYYRLEEGPTPRRIQRGRLVKDDSPSVIKAEEPNTLSKVIQSVKGEKRPKICFAYLRNPSLTLRERITSYTTSSSMSRHFLRKYFKKLQGGVDINY